MPDLWDEWQQSMRDGRPDRAAEALSDEELINLLAACPDDLMRSPATRALKQEAMERLHRAPRADRPGRIS